MRLLGLTVLIGLAACSAPNAHAPVATQTSASAPTSIATADRPAVPATPSASKPLEDGGSFAGVWEDCDEGGSPDDCSRYVLVQHGDRICGTWSYVATADYYEGRLQAKALSATTARRTQVCGRPGSETQTECASGWQSIDKPLQLCDGKLAESSGSECNARYRRSAEPGTQLTALAEQPWVKACLAGAEAAP
ncbi:hypothetical protein [Lysobacter sp. HA35]